MIEGGKRIVGKVGKSYDMPPMITIITIVLNDEKNIEKTIVSIVNQRYTNFEFIIIDGGSGDKTIEVIKQYELKIDYWCSEPDGGIYYAMNKGIELANGRYILFMNSGDEFFSNDVLTKVFQNPNSGAEIIYGNTAVDFGGITSVNIAGEVNRSNTMPFCHQSVFVRTEVLQARKFDINFMICADRNFFTNCFFDNIQFHFMNIVISKIKAFGYSTRESIIHVKEQNKICLRYGTISKFVAYKKMGIIIFRYLFIKGTPHKLRILYHTWNSRKMEIEVVSTERTPK